MKTTKKEVRNAKSTRSNDKRYALLVSVLIPLVLATCALESVSSIATAERAVGGEYVSSIMT